MQQTNALNSAINSNRAMYQQMTQPSVASNKAHLVNSYYGDKTQYYNDQVAIKKEQRKKIGKIATTCFAVLATLGILGNTSYQIASKYVNFGKLGNQAKDALDKTIHFFMNFDMSRNNLWKNCSHKISTNTPINTEKWIDEPIEKFYSMLGKFFNNRKYEKGVEILERNNKVLNLADIPKTGEYAEWFDKQGKVISETIANSNEHATDMFKKAVEAYKNDTSSSFINKIKKAISTLLTEGCEDVIEDRKLMPIYKSQTTSKTEKFLKDFNLDNEQIGLISGENKLVFRQNTKTIDSIKEWFENIKKAKNIKKQLVSDIAKKLEGTCDNPQKEAKKVAKSLIDIHKITSDGAREVLEKQRDIRLGNNSVELLTNLGTVASLGIAVSRADTKERKKSIMTNLGIPLLTALGFSSVGGVLNISGAKAAITGLIIGQVASQGAKLADKKLNGTNT